MIKRLALAVLMLLPMSLAAKEHDYALYPPRVPEPKEIIIVPPGIFPQFNTFCAANLACTVTAAWTFSGATFTKNLENSWFYEDQFAGASVGARVSAALLSGCGSAACTVVIPATEASTEVLGNLTTAPSVTQIILDLRNSGPGATQGTNWLLCDFSGSVSDSPCRNGGGGQVFQFGRTFNNAPTTGGVGGTVDVKYTGISANTIAFPLVGMGSVVEANGLTQSNGTPAPLINFDAALNMQGNNSTIPAWRMFSTDPGGLANSGTGNAITNLYGYFAQSCAACVPAGLTVTNWYNAWFTWPKATGVTNAFSMVSDVQSWFSDGGFTGSGAKEIVRIRGPLSGGGARTGDMLQVTDSANGDATVFQILGSPAGLMVARKNAQILQGANGNDALFMARATDSGPTGFLIHTQNTANNSDLFNVGVTGNITLAGTIGSSTSATTMGLTLKKGSGAGNYTTASTTFVVADSTNLCFTVTIPTGWKLGVSASGSLATATAAVAANVALTDNAACATANAGILQDSGALGPASGIGVFESFSLGWVITGDGASHSIALQYRTSNAADSATLLNASASQLPTMKFELMPSN